MQRRLSSAWSFFVVCVAIGLAGCGGENKKEKDTGGGGGGHHAKGPHGGHIMDLGRGHKLHAELVEDEDQKSVTVYVLDGKLADRPISASSITFILASDTPQTFELTAVDAVDGKSARFDAPDSKLHEAMEAQHGANIKLRVDIDGDQHTALLKHADAHDH